MATPVKIPAMGESITSGILSIWHVKEGDYVEEGTPLFELETDKISSDAVAEVAGIISLKVAEGDEVAIGQIVAEITPSEKKPASKVKQASEEKSAKPEKPPVPKPTAPPDTSKSDILSPAVRRLVNETGINPASVQGSGKGGRVTKGDLLEQAPTPSKGPRTSRKKMSPLRKRIAERLVIAQQEAAILTTFNEVDMQPIMELRKRYQEEFVAKYGIKLGFMSFFVKAVVKALQEIPQLNAQIDGDEIVQNHYYDIGIAIGAPKGLIVPVVRDCDQLRFHEIELAIRNYAEKAKAGKISLEDLEGGVFTISNGGTYGSILSTPILNSPQSGILGMHAIKERAMVVDGQIVIRPMMYLALSYDHRLVDGKEAVTFLCAIKEALEDPVRSMFRV